MVDGFKLSELTSLGGPATGTDLFYIVRAGASLKALVSQLRITAAQISDATTFGKDLIAATGASAARTLMELGDLAVLDTIDTAQISAAAVSLAKLDDLPENNLIVGDAANRPVEFVAEAYGLSLIQAADAAAVGILLGLGDLALLDTIGTAQIDAEAVTTAKMADLVEDSILIGDASDRPTALLLSALGHSLLTATAAADVTDATDNEDGAYTGIDNAQAGSVYAQLTDLNALRVAYEDIRATYNALLTSIRSLGLIA